MKKINFLKSIANFGSVKIWGHWSKSSRCQGSGHKKIGLSNILA